MFILQDFLFFFFLFQLLEWCTVKASNCISIIHLKHILSMTTVRLPVRIFIFSKQQMRQLYSKMWQCVRTSYWTRSYWIASGEKWWNYNCEIREQFVWNSMWTNDRQKLVYWTVWWSRGRCEDWSRELGCGMYIFSASLFC